MKKLLSWVGLAVSVACIAVFLASTTPHWGVLAATTWDAPLSIAVVASLCAYIASYASSTLGWQYSLRVLGQRVDYIVLGRILVLSQLAKYLPGNVGHHIGRVVLARRVGLRTEPIIGSMALDMLVLLTSAAICSLPAAALVQQMLEDHGIWQAKYLAVIAIVVTLVGSTVAIVPAARGAIARYARILADLNGGRLLLFAKAGFAHCATFAFGATALYLLGGAFSQNFDVYWLPVLGIYTASWLIGFVVPGAPAGLGLREVALLIGLTPIYGEQAALAAAAMLRLVTTTSDGLVFLLGLLRRNTKSPSEGELPASVDRR